MTRSRYDNLHDRFQPILSGKAGTRYERLTAMVWKALNERDAVIHDMKLVGESDVAHQIDVTIDQAGKKQRIILECKDFDVAQDTVGLDIVRSFRSVLEDTKADEGILITCVGFTRDARKYAKAKSIKLVILREFTSSDWLGRIRTIVLNLHAKWLDKLQITSLKMSNQSHGAFTTQLSVVGIGSAMTNQSPVTFVKGIEKRQFNEFIEQQANILSAALPPGPHVATIAPDGWEISVDGGAPITFDNIDISFEVKIESTTNHITSDRIAEILVSGFGNDDLIIFADQLERRRLKATGEIE